MGSEVTPLLKLANALSAHALSEQLHGNEWATIFDTAAYLLFNLLHPKLVKIKLK